MSKKLDSPIKAVPTYQPLLGRWHKRMLPLVVDFGYGEISYDPGAITDFASIPSKVELVLGILGLYWPKLASLREDIKVAADYHDQARREGKEENYEIDAHFRRCVYNELLRNGYEIRGAYIVAWLVYVAVRIGDHTGFDGTPPEEIRAIANQYPITENV